MRIIFATILLLVSGPLWAQMTYNYSVVSACKTTTSDGVKLQVSCPVNDHIPNLLVTISKERFSHRADANNFCLRIADSFSTLNDGVFDLLAWTKFQMGDGLRNLMFLHYSMVLRSHPIKDNQALYWDPASQNDGLILITGALNGVQVEKKTLADFGNPSLPAVCLSLSHSEYQQMMRDY